MHSQIQSRSPGNQRITRSLLLFSGGIDSTYSLVRLLGETRDLVYVHHVHFIDPTHQASRIDFETIAPQVREPLAWMREQMRDFEYSQSLIDVSMFATRARENTSLMFFAAQAAMNYGFSPFDRILLGVNADTDPGWNPDSPVYAWRRTLLVRMLRSVWECDEVPYLYFWNPRPSKRAMLESLPEELARRTFSCSAPVPDPEHPSGQSPCGVCPKCQWRAQIRRLHEGLYSDRAISTARTPPRSRHRAVGPSKMPAPCHSV